MANWSLGKSCKKSNPFALILQCFLSFYLVHDVIILRFWSVKDRGGYKKGCRLPITTTYVRNNFLSLMSYHIDLSGWTTGFRDSLRLSYLSIDLSSLIVYYITYVYHHQKNNCCKISDISLSIKLGLIITTLSN